MKHGEQASLGWVSYVMMATTHRINWLLSTTNSGLEFLICFRLGWRRIPFELRNLAIVFAFSSFCFTFKVLVFS